MLSRVVRDGLTASALKVPIAAPSEAEIELTIDDGANEPLDLRAVSVMLAELPWIYFEAPAGAVTARYGNLTLPRPAYDLEAVRSSVDLAKLREARWGDQLNVRLTKVAGAPATPVPNAGPTLDPAAFKYTRAVALQLEGGQKIGGLVALPLDAHALAYTRGPSRAVRRHTIARWRQRSRFRISSSGATSRCQSTCRSRPHRTCRPRS